MKKVLRRANCSPRTITTPTSASPTAPSRGPAPQRCSTDTSVELGAPQDQNAVELEESCPRGSQICLLTELGLIHKFYSELQYVKDKGERPVQNQMELRSLQQHTQRKHSTALGPEAAETED